ncbi:AAA family ATPase [soil metagenome]
MTARAAPPATVAFLVQAIRDRQSDGAVLIVAIDGRSGAGKSTLAAAVAAEVGAVVIGGDDFYAGGSAAEWDERSAVEKATTCIDWRRQRGVLESIRAGAEPTWQAFDWEAFDGRLAEEVQHRPRSPVVILEGAYSARPELADLLDLRVLLDTPPAIRRQQLLEREGDDYRDDWEGRWSEAEDHYFGRVVPASAFDLVLGWDPR